MAQRLIDAERLKRHYSWWECTESGNERKKVFDTIIDLQPTADVVEVVRCKNCKWFNDFGCAIRIVDESDKPKEDDFCSFGERRTDDAEQS